MTIGEFVVPGGMLYVHSGMLNPAQRHHGVIEADLPVSTYDVPYKREVTRAVGYWQLHPDLRRRFLQWLAGRRRGQAPIGFPYMVLFGLEKRVLEAVERNTNDAYADLPRIREFCMQLMFEQTRDAAFGSAVGALIDVISMLTAPNAVLRVHPVPFFPPSPRLPCYLRLAIGQCARDNASLPAPLALGWVLGTTDLFHGMVVTRCTLQFKRLFEHRYHEKFGGALSLPKGGKAHVTLDYVPSNPSLAKNGVKKDFPDAPDIADYPGVLEQLTSLAKSVANELEAYARRIGRNADRTDDSDCVLLLPPQAWWPEADAKLRVLRESTARRAVALPLTELLAMFSKPCQLSRDEYAQLATALSQFGLGIEPAAEPNLNRPHLGNLVAVYRLDEKPLPHGRDPHFERAVVLANLAGHVCAADGPVGDEELRCIERHLLQWTTLDLVRLPRLLAMALVAGNVSTPRRNLGDPLVGLSRSVRESLGDFLIKVAAVDGPVNDAEAKSLEKAFSTLALDGRQLFVGLREVGYGPSSPAARVAPPSPVSASAPRTAMKLDPKRIAQVQQDARQSAALLASIFVDEHSPQSGSLPVAVAVPGCALPGLDAAHAAFASHLGAQAKWSRVELEALADQLGLMLDGALEVVNDACFDAHDLPLTEGDDPVAVNQDVLSASAP